MSGGHKLTKANNSLGGKNSKRGISRSKSLRNALQAFYSNDLDIFIDEMPNKTIFERKRIDECLNIVIIAKALSGDVPAHKEINDRVDGKSHQSLDVDLTVENVDLSALTKKQIKELAEKHLRK